MGRENKKDDAALHVLADMDIEHAHRLLENVEIPRWLAMPKTALPPSGRAGRAPAPRAASSPNHYSKGAVLQWEFDTMCGISVTGENRFAIASRPGGHFTRAEAKYVSVYGPVESRWKRRETGTKFVISIPLNCTAAIRLPDGSTAEQGPREKAYQI